MLFDVICGAIIVTLSGLVVRRYGLRSLPAFAVLIFTIGFIVRVFMLRQYGIERVFRVLSINPYMTQKMLWIATIGFLTMCVGIILGTRRPLRKKPKSPSESVYRPGLLLAAFVATMLFQAWSLSQTLGGGVAAFDALSRRSFTGESIGFAANLTFAAIPLALFGIVIARRAGRRGLERFGILLFFLSLPLLSVINGRSVVVTALWAFAIALLIESQRRLRLIATIPAAAAIVAASVVGLAWRLSAQTGLPFGQLLRTGWKDVALTVSDAIPLFDHLRVGMEYVTQTGHDHGASLPTALTVIVPRSAWPGKPKYMPQILAERLLGNDMSGLPPGLVGEGWIAGGWIGVIGYALVFGFIVGLAHRHIKAAERLTPETAWLVFVSTSFVMGGLRTGAQGGLIMIIIALLFLPIVLMAAKFAERPAARRFATKAAHHQRLLRERNQTTQSGQTVSH
jgi:oligosaccharide repeat unit polymerase